MHELNNNDAKAMDTFFDLPLLLFRFGAAIILGLFGYNMRVIFNPTRRGFFCKDDSIRLPYHDSTIESSTLFFVVIPLILVLLIIGEFICNNNSPYYGKRYNLRCWRFHITLLKIVQLSRFTSIWMLGVSVNIFMFNVFKLTLGNLRPNFIDACHPYIGKMNWENCTTFGENYYFSGQEYKCQNGDENVQKIIDTKLSFYSGHSSLSFFFAFFIILYTHIRIASRWYFVFPFFIIFYSSIITIAGIVAMSRITDHKHHPIDVIVGSLIGTLFAIFSVYLHKDTFFTTDEKVSTIAAMQNLEDRKKDQTTENTQV